MVNCGAIGPCWLSFDRVYLMRGLSFGSRGVDWWAASWSGRTCGKVEVIRGGGLRYGLSDQPIVEMSHPVTKITLFPLLVWSERDNELPVLEFGGNSIGYHIVAMFSPE